MTSSRIFRWASTTLLVITVAASQESFASSSTPATESASIVTAAPGASAAPASTAVKEKESQGSDLEKTLARAKEIYIACKLYSDEFNANFPQTLAELVPGYIMDKELLHDPQAPVDPQASDEEAAVSFHYYGGKSLGMPNKVLLVSKAVGANKTRVVIRCDGSGAITQADEQGE